jgi:hypothetical protein
MFVPLLAAALINATPSPGPSPNIPCAGKCLAGISVGDDKYRVLARLDSRPLPGSDARIMGDFNSYPDGLMLAVYYQKAIVAVSISSFDEKRGRITIADPYGVKLEDTSDRLTALRGKPDTIDGTVWRYGPVNSIHWDYTIDKGAVTKILLSSVSKLF